MCRQINLNEEACKNQAKRESSAQSFRATSDVASPSAELVVSSDNKSEFNTMSAVRPHHLKKAMSKATPQQKNITSRVFLP